MAAAQEERFTRIKHDQRFPDRAIQYCLQEAGITAAELDYVAFYEKPLLKFDRLLETYLAYAPSGFRSFCQALPLWLRQKLHLPREMDRGLQNKYTGRYVFPEHHESHAASAFFPSPFERAAILTLDGVGEWATATIGEGEGHRIRLTHEIHFPHSLGLLYTAFTAYAGFRVNSGEYKLMGLAPYGEPRYVDLILENLVDIKADGSFRLNMRYFNYCQGLTMTHERFHRLFGHPPRKPESPLTQFYMDVAASIQKVTEEIILRAVRHLLELTGQRNLCLAGGVALNCVANGRILRETPVENIWVQPAAGDAGGALGAALLVWHQLLGNPRRPRPGDSQQASLLGPSYSDGEIREFLESVASPHRHFSDDAELADIVADFIAQGKVVGWFQGRMEFGPRALGSRSILGDARSEEMQKIMNLKIKFRESFRPFAPSVLHEEVDQYFEVRRGEESPYMLIVADVRPEKRARCDDQLKSARGLEKLSIPRSAVPAVTHVDYSARIQTVDRERHGRYYLLLKTFHQKTGCPVIINTSFNVRGEPIVCTPEDAYHCFMATNMDVLVMGEFVLTKEEQPADNLQSLDEYLAAFGID